MQIDAYIYMENIKRDYIWIAINTYQFNSWSPWFAIDVRVWWNHWWKSFVNDWNECRFLIACNTHLHRIDNHLVKHKRSKSIWFPSISCDFNHCITHIKQRITCNIISYQIAINLSAEINHFQSHRIWIHCIYLFYHHYYYYCYWSTCIWYISCFPLFIWYSSLLYINIYVA